MISFMDMIPFATRSSSSDSKGTDTPSIASYMRLAKTGELRSISSNSSTSICSSSHGCFLADTTIGEGRPAVTSSPTSRVMAGRVSFRGAA